MSAGFLIVTMKELGPVFALILIGGFSFGGVLGLLMMWLDLRKERYEIRNPNSIVMPLVGVLLTAFWYMVAGNKTVLLVFTVIMIVAAVSLATYLGKLRLKNDPDAQKRLQALEDEASALRASNTTNRNTPPSLAGHWKVIFYLTVLPLFVALLVVNVLLIERYAPFLVGLFRAADGGDGEALIGFLISCPLPVAFSFAWYKFISWLAKRDRIARQKWAAARGLQAPSTRRPR